MYEQLKAGWSQLPPNATGAEDDKESIKSYLKRNKNSSFAAFSGNQMIGAILAGHDGRRAILNHLFVLPEFRNSGIGKQLVTLSFNELKKHKIKRAAVFVHKTNDTAQKFWIRIGFEKVEFIETYGIDL